ncbi:MAG: outer membrane protein assembly factor BamD [Paludibacteraceae bacterium]|nr:outer membrane protein assembly factor BamD [Paludibacteraceae bacterium]
MRQTQRYILGVCFALMMVLTGCGEYQALLKSNDPELKYEKALEYFNRKEYAKAQTLLDDVSSYYRGTERSEDVLAYLARCYMGQKDYASAAQYYEAYIRNYPKGRYATEARFQLGHCYYLDSPDARLDQETTRKGIEALTQFVELFPDSPYSEQAYEEITELTEKLALKELYSARLYYNLGSYLGNNYLSCEITSRNALKEYPDTQYAEDFHWLILQAKYQQTLISYEEKRLDRARETQDECYNFLTDYPESKHRSQAERMLREMQKITKE